ncbi:MAG: PLP-dependent cysteine synthase family protein, partial [Microbacterium gubbeenense]
QLIARMLASGERGSVVTLICDGGARYSATHYNDEWIAEQGLDLAPERARIEGFLTTGVWD